MSILKVPSPTPNHRKKLHLHGQPANETTKFHSSRTCRVLQKQHIVLFDKGLVLAKGGGGAAIKVS